MKKILVTLSLICFVAFVSNAQTTPTATSKATTTKEVKTEATATAAPEAKKSGCCHKGMSAADCKKKGMKDCVKTGADAKDQKTSTKEGTNN